VLVEKLATCSLINQNHSIGVNAMHGHTLGEQGIQGCWVSL